MPEDRIKRPHQATLLLLTLVAVAWRCWWARSAPPGMNHDAADNILAAADPEGLGLLFTQSHGMAKESLFHYLLRPLLGLFPAETALTVLSVALGSLAVPATWLLLGAAGLRSGRIAGTLWVSLGLWPVLYSLVGFRVVCGLPLAFLGLAGVLEVQTRRRDQRPLPSWLLIGTGLALSAGLYTYTTGKLVALAGVAWLALELLRNPGTDRKRILGLGFLGLIPAAPWVVALVGTEGEAVLARGAYVFRADGPEAWTLLRDCLLLPFHLGEQYGHISRSDFISDGAAVVFPLTGARPMALPVSLLLLLGLLPGAPGRGRSLAIFLFLLHVVVLGAAGPSPTRFLLTIPALSLLVGTGSEWLLKQLEQRLGGNTSSSLLLATLVGAVTLGCAMNSAVGLEPHERAWVYFPASVSQATEVAVGLPVDRTPVVVVPHSRSVVDVAVRGRPDLQVVEFYRVAGSLQDAALPENLARPLFVLVIHERVQVFAGSLMEAWPAGSFRQIHGPSDHLHGGVVLFDPEGG